MEQKFGKNSIDIKALREFCEREGKMVEYRKSAGQILFSKTKRIRTLKQGEHHGSVVNLALPRRGRRCGGV